MAGDSTARRYCEAVLMVMRCDSDGNEEQC